MQDLSVVYGIHPILEALNSGKTIDKILVRNGLSGPNVDSILANAKERKIPINEVPIEKLNRVTMKNHQGIIAFMSPVSYVEIDTLIPTLFEEGKVPFVLILDRVTDVRNFAALCRTAECAGVHAVLIPAKGSAQINADAVKSSAGAVQNIPICRSMNLKNTLRFLRDSGLKIVACTEKGSNLLYEGDLSGPLAIILGSEEDGVSPEYLKLCHESVKIPMFGKTGSLNVGAAGAVILYEAVRQRS